MPSASFNWWHDFTNAAGILTITPTKKRVSLVDPGGTGIVPPQQDPILSFSQTFLLKSKCIGGGHPPPQFVSTPQQEILDPQLGRYQVYKSTVV